MGKQAPLGVSASGLPPSQLPWVQSITDDAANTVVQDIFAAVGPGLPFAVRGPMNIAIWGSFATTLTTTNGSTTATVGAGGAMAPGASINSVNVPRGSTWATFSGTSGTIALPKITLRGVTNTVKAQISGLAQTAGLIGATVTGPGIPANTTVLSVAQAAVPGTLNNPQGSPGTVVISAVPTATDPTGRDQPFVFALTSNAITTGADANATFTGAAIVANATVQVERSFDGAASFLPCNVGGSGLLAQYAVGAPIQLTFGEPEKSIFYRLNCTAYAGVSGVTLNYRMSTTGEAATSLSVPSVI